MSANVSTQNHQSSSVISRTVSKEGFVKALSILNDQRPVEITQLLPSWVCKHVIERYSGPFPAMSNASAVQATVTLLSGYPYAFKGGEMEKTAYMRRIESVFSLFPEWAGAAVVAAGKGLAATSAFLPSEAELTDALQAQVTKARAYAVKAQWHVDEGIRRAKQEELDSACSKLSPEAKAALVSRAFARIKPMSDDQPHTTQDKAMNRQFEIQLKSKMEAQ